MIMVLKRICEDCIEREMHAYGEDCDAMMSYAGDGECVKCGEIKQLFDVKFVPLMEENNDNL